MQIWIIGLLLTWNEIFIGNAQKGNITTLNRGKSYIALYASETIYLHEVFEGADTLFYSITDSSGIFDISSYDTITLLANKVGNNEIRITRFINLSKDTTFVITTPSECNKILIYNDGHIHPSFPIWYLLCQTDAGIFMSHSIDHGNTFYPPDTILLDTGLVSFDFTTSVNVQGDRLHLVYAKRVNDIVYLYLINGSYPATFAPPIEIDSMIPDSGHFSVYAKGDTIFVAYERLSSDVLHDIDLYYAISFYEGSSWNLGLISATTNDEINPVIIPSYDTLKVFYIKENEQNPSSIEECIFMSPYTESIIFTTIGVGNFLSIYADKNSIYPAILALDDINNGYLIYDDTYSKITENPQIKRDRKEYKKNGTFIITGQRTSKKLKSGIYFKDGKKVLILK